MQKLIKKALRTKNMKFFISYDSHGIIQNVTKKTVREQLTGKNLDNYLWGLYDKINEVNVSWENLKTTIHIPSLKMYKCVNDQNYDNLKKNNSYLGLKVEGIFPAYPYLITFNKDLKAHSVSYASRFEELYHD